MAEHQNMFMAIREERIVSIALKDGVGAAAYEFNLPIWEVKQMVLRARQDHLDIMKRHQDSIAELSNLLGRSGCYKCGKDGHIAKHCKDASCYKCGKVGHVARNCTDGAEVRCRLCYKSGHMTRDCSGDGCCKCRRVGHLGRNCDQDHPLGHSGRLCYFCGMRGYMAVCSLCGERGHLGKDCWTVRGDSHRA
ncbi:DNA-binding protein HEXBP [Artemisia annua]|uniref:DNA-binding protein HEXBP n=1 Tax=Artemisia annua TaxID=35608 RepID=A0A2U1MZC3_ARTAN|nr:DNA-binding protein HEXBP [Artemisia annua]